VNLDRFALLSFDCYGTLIDWERGILDALRRDFERAGVAMDQDAVLAAFAESEPKREQEAPTDPYPLILQRVHSDLAARFGLALAGQDSMEPNSVERNSVGRASRPSTTTPVGRASRPSSSQNEDSERFARSIGDWPPFPDTAESLRRLKERFRLVILSNVDRESFARTNEQLGVTFDAVITAQDVGAYKPDQRMFDRLIETARSLGVERGAILHVAQSLYHDIAPAKRAGLRTFWVDRPGAGAVKATENDAQPDLTVRSVRELAETILT